MWETLVFQYDQALARGGFVMPPLLLGAALMWYAMGYRFLLLRRGTSAQVSELVADVASGTLRPSRGLLPVAAAGGVALWRKRPAHLRRHLDVLFADLTASVGRFRVVQRSVVMAAPLLGLLGTVSGMIETFASLGDGTLHGQAGPGQSGGIAGGIAQALFSTQMGLVVAVCGLFLGRLLDQQQQAREMALEEIKDIVCLRDRQQRTCKN